MIIVLIMLQLVSWSSQAHSHHRHFGVRRKRVVPAGV